MRSTHSSSPFYRKCIDRLLEPTVPMLRSMRSTREPKATRERLHSMIVRTRGPARLPRMSGSGVRT